MLSFLSSRATAAHLALLAVAPLVLCKYFGYAAVIPLVIWIAAVALVWGFMAPSKGENEHSPDARRRMVHRVRSDPFVWMAMALVGYCAIVALNDGVALAYDVERTIWNLRSPSAPTLPGSVAGAGGVFFMTAVLLLVLYPGVVHSLDSRQSVYFTMFAAAILVADVLLAVSSGIAIPANAAVAYGIWTLMSASAMLSAERSQYRVKEMFSVIVLSGCIAALLFTGRPVEICVFAASLVALVLIFVIFAFRQLGIAGILRAFMLLLVASMIGVAVFYWHGGDFIQLIPDWSKGSNVTVNTIAYNAWSGRPWLGVGLGAFPLAAKITATSSDWAAMGPLPDFYGNGWLSMLVERGMIGILAVITAIGALIYVWFRRVRMRGLKFFSAALPLLPLALAAVGVSWYFDGSSLCAESMVAFAALAAYSVNGGL